MWERLNIEEAKINMSKVLPFDRSLTILDAKQGFYHNNRLTALHMYETPYALGYKCFKRRKGEKYDEKGILVATDYTIDGELTDYIEINKIDDDGSVHHMINVSDSCYKKARIALKPEEGSGRFGSGVVLDDSLIGSYAEWGDAVFYKVGVHTYLAWHTSTNLVQRIYCKQKMDSDNLNNNRDVVGLPVNADEMYLFCDDTNLYIFGSEVDELLSYVTELYNGHIDSRGSFKFPSVEMPALDRKEYTGWTVPRNGTQVISRTLAYAEGTTGKREVYLAEHMMYRASLDKMTDVGDHGFWSYYSLAGSGAFNFEPEAYADRALGQYGTDYDIGQNLQFSKAGFAQTELSTSRVLAFFINNQKHEREALSFDKPAVKLADGISNTTVANYNADSVFVGNSGFVINYLNKQPVTLGHRYKVIARLDTQGAYYAGISPENGRVRINQLGETYEVWLDKMFPNVPYNSEVNIIESDYCNRVGGYKIFNTTTYYNAIYDDNPKKICCSCDDWNGRYFSTSEGEDAVLESTSRVNGFWNSTAFSEQIPAVSISDELISLKEFANPKYEWVNKAYTIHDGTEAYIYTAGDEQTDTMLQRWRITTPKEGDSGFNLSYDRTKVFAHNQNYELVPSVLFTTFLKSDVINALQVGSECYQLKKYSYAPTIPSLVYSSEAIAINIDSSAREMIIQGCYYSIGGARDSRRIINPYDTSINTYCCNVTGLKYLGYDTKQGYFYAPGTGVIYTFNGANTLNAFLEVDKRTPLESGETDDNEKVGIDICNIPSMNIIAMAFTDGVLVIVNGQSLFIEVQNVTDLSVSEEYGLIKINGKYYYFGTNSVMQNLIKAEGREVERTSMELRLKTVKVGDGRLANITASKHRIIIFSDSLDSTHKAAVTVKLSGLLGDKEFSESHRKEISSIDLISNEYQWEFNPKYTKAQYFQIEIIMTNADLLDYFIDLGEKSEENLVR